MIAREEPSSSARGGEPIGEDQPEKRLDSAGRSPLEPLLKHFAELQMLVGHYFRARADNISTQVRKLVFWIVAGVVGLVVAIAFLVTAVVLVLHGIAVGLMLLGLPGWAADLITGGVCIGIVALVLVFATMSQSRAARRKRRDDYEHFRARYRAKFGRSFDETGRD